MLYFSYKLPPRVIIKMSKLNIHSVDSFKGGGQHREGTSLRNLQNGFSKQIHVQACHLMLFNNLNVYLSIYKNITITLNTVRD